MWFIVALLFSAICCGALAFILGLAVGIEEQRRRDRNRPVSAPSEAPKKASDLERLGIVPLD